MNTTVVRNKPIIPEGWIEWAYSDKKQYPETLHTKVSVMFGDGELYSGALVSDWVYCKEGCTNNWKTDILNARIVAYKVM